MQETCVQPLGWEDALEKGKATHSSGASLVAQLVKSPPAMWETWVEFLGWKDPWRRSWQPTPVFLPGEFHGQKSLAG